MFATLRGKLHGSLCCVVEIICQRPKTTKLSHPRGDVDNFVKGALDAATKAGVWGDDTQVIALGVTKRWTEGDEAPGIIFTTGKAKETT